MDSFEAKEKILDCSSLFLLLLRQKHVVAPRTELETSKSCGHSWPSDQLPTRAVTHSLRGEHLDCFSFDSDQQVRPHLTRILVQYCTADPAYDPDCDVLGTETDVSTSGEAIT